MVFKEVDLGTHTIFIGNAAASEIFRQGQPLSYQYYRDDMNGNTWTATPNFPQLD